MIRRLISKTVAICAILSASLASCQEGLGTETGDGNALADNYIFVGIDNTRTSVDAAGKTVWSEGDSLYLTCGGESAIYVLDPSDAGKTTAKFVASSAVPFGKGAEVKAYYPASIAGGQLEWPANQVYTENAGCPMYASATVVNGGQAPSLTFKNLGSILRLNLSSSQEKTVKSIRIESSDPLAGGFDISADKAVLNGDRRAIVLDCGDGVAIGATPKPFSISVPANAGDKAYSAFNVLIETTDGQFAETDVDDLPKVLVRNTVYDLSVAVPSFYLGFANCYVVKPNKTYVMRADLAGNLSVRNTEYLLKNPVSAKLVYETQNSSRAPEPNSIIKAGMTYDNGFITFQTGIEGNAMIAVYDAGGNALWSWHIWVRKTSPANYTAEGVTYMDRELGALSASGQGLSYQYSRKDPLMDVVGTTGKKMMWTVDGIKTNENQSVALNTTDFATDFTGRYSSFDFAIKHPGLQLIKGTYTSSGWYSNTVRLSNYFWANGKFGIGCVEDLMDPCPYGYHVPNINELQTVLSGANGYTLKNGGSVAVKEGLVMGSGVLSTSWTGMAYWTNISYTGSSYDVFNGQTYYLKSNGSIGSQNFSGSSQMRVRCIQN